MFFVFVGKGSEIICADLKGLRLRKIAVNFVTLQTGSKLLPVNKKTIMTIYQFLKVLDTLNCMERLCQFNVVCKTNCARYERHKRFLELMEGNPNEKSYNILMDLSIESGVSVQGHSTDGDIDFVVVDPPYQ